jgi:hypothetical protein
MTTFKLLFIIFFATLLTIGASSAQTTAPHPVNNRERDTTWTTSTKQLKSDQIPDSIFLLTGLRHLSINGMDCDFGNSTNCWMIKEIPKDIKRLQQLVTLRLTLHAITRLPKELTELHHLTLIDLTDNAGLTNINCLTQVPNLQYLYLYGCSLTKLPDNIGDLKNLKELGLTGNHLDKAEQARIKKALPNCAIKF